MLTGKVVVVIGGAGLLGSAIVRSILKENAEVVVADFDEKKAFAFKEQLRGEIPDSRIELINMDITSIDSVDEGIKKVAQSCGKIDAVINAAYPRNSRYGATLMQVTYSDFCENLNLHLGGYFLVSQRLSNYFLAQGHGNIINVSSIYGVIAPKFQIYEDTEMTMPVEYAAIKSAIIHLTKYFAAFFKGKNIRVNCVSPGGILNNQPVEFTEKYNKFCNSKGMLSPEDLASTFILLLSDGGKYISGQNIVVDDGFCL